jgi:primosomal protein N' (replication factor Y)
MNYAKVILFKKPGEYDQPLTYEVPADLRDDCVVGQVVIVPLRRQTVCGLVTELSEGADPGIAVKPIAGIKSGLSIPEKQVMLAKRLAAYYHCSLLRMLKTMLPKKVWRGERTQMTQVCYAVRDPSAVLRGGKQSLIYQTLLDTHLPMSVELLNEAVGSDCRASLRTLIKNGVVEAVNEPLYSPFDPALFPLSGFQHELTQAQQAAIHQIERSDKPVLLQGVTGSGKTEIYLRLIASAVNQGKQSVLLVPEIALTPQMLDYFRRYFGRNLALFHSRMSDGERFQEWLKVKTGFAPLVIGSRSAIFAPLNKPGLIIMDEEHEWTYKQESMPYYQTHTVAEMMQELWALKLVLGSATPRLESYQKAVQGGYGHVVLDQRINREALPAIQVVDLREEFKRKNYSIFSSALHQAIQKRLTKGEQVILFVNQRGLARAVVCRDCGAAEQCPHCDIALKLHGGSDTYLLCHYCHFRKPPELTCAFCGSAHIRHAGIGTERVERDLLAAFPGVRAARADKDTTSGKSGFEPIYHDFKERHYDVLIGTQMVAKGLDFPDVTLIGMVLADIGLHIPDFRSQEKLFQLITQVAGRCGRADKQGEVILQSYQPDHFAIRRAAEYDYAAFIESEIGFRKKLNYPPFSRMLKFTVVGADLNRLQKHIEVELEFLEDLKKREALNFDVSASPAVIPRMSGLYYYQVYVKIDDPQVLLALWNPPKYWRLDVDPMQM